MQQKKVLDEILNALSGVRAGSGYKCVCPAHEDKTASLSVTPSGDKLLFHCFAGCSYQQITNALKARGLMQNTARPNLRAVNSRIEAVYDYADENGNVLFQKLRKEGKKFSLRKRDINGKWQYKNVTQGIDVPLYRLPEVLASPCVCVAEGEKDADNLAALGYAATCNFDGAGKWRSSYNKWLRGKDVVLFEDNDAPGRAHVEKVGRSLQGVAASVRVVKFAEMPEKSDVSDWLATGKNADDLRQLISSALPFQPSAEELPPEDEQDATPQHEDEDRIPNAKYDDYVTLFESVLEAPRRDIFTDKLMTRDRGLWVPAINCLPIIRSAAARLEEQRTKRFKRPLIEDYLFDFERSKEPEFLAYIPEWDKRDRIKEFSDAIILRDGDVTQKDFCELLKEWLSIALQRLENPETQNRILILKGNQGIGKDTWIDSLLAGAGQFAGHMSVVTGDKDTFLQLHRGLFLKISEFDKTARTEVSLLKDLITAHSTDLRAQYERDFRRRYVRCSFISSCNVDDILRDHTGSRRYLIFDVDRIDWTYPRTHYDSQQILAQARDLCRQGFRAGEQAQDAMRAYLDAKTPEDPALDTVDAFNGVAAKMLEGMTIEKRMLYEKRGWIPNSDCGDIIERVGKMVGLHPRTVRSHLKQLGLMVKCDGVRGYRIDFIERDRRDTSGQMIL